MAQNAYQKLAQEVERLSLFSRGASLLSWDQEVLMPVNASDERAAILSAMQAYVHAQKTSAGFGDMIAAAEIEDLDAWEKRNVALLREAYDTNRHVPEALVGAIAHAASTTQRIWEDARRDNDWHAILPHLDALQELEVERATILAEVKKLAPYDVMLDEFARGNRVADIDVLFGEVKQALPPLMDAIAAHQKNWPQDNADIIITPEKFSALQWDIAATFGYTKDDGRIDYSAHPFSGGTSRDSRITMSKTEAPIHGVYSLLHELGHARYEQNLPRAFDGQPVGRSGGMALHESQSLFFEKQIGYHPAYMRYLHDRIKPIADALPDVTAMQRALSRVRTGLIRIEADEVTYPLHIVVRYEIEKDWIGGALATADIPEAWNAKYKEYLGIDVPNDAQGCMQDVHWYCGLYGYFPCYTQGALWAAQLAATIRREMPDFDARIGKGDVKPIVDALKSRVHMWGCFYDDRELIERAFGEAPSARYFIDHVQKRYLGNDI